MEGNQRNLTKPFNNMRSMSNNKSNRIRMEHWKVVAVMVAFYDVVVVNGAFFLALWLRFDCAFSMIPKDYLYAWSKFTPLYSGICFVVFFGGFHLWKGQ